MSLKIPTRSKGLHLKAHPHHSKNVFSFQNKNLNYQKKGFSGPALNHSSKINTYHSSSPYASSNHCTFWKKAPISKAQPEASHAMPIRATHDNLQKRSSFSLKSPLQDGKAPIHPSEKASPFSRDNPQTAKWAARVFSLPQSTVWQTFTPLALEHKSVNLGQGFPDYEAPAFVLASAEKAINNHFNQYSRVQGHPRLVNALADYYSASFERKIEPMTEIQTTIGATEGLFAICQALVSPGDEVILIEPFYDAYPCDVFLAGGVPRFSSTKWNSDRKMWELDFPHLQSLINSKTKLLFLNNPQNVSGKVYSREELEKIAEIAQKNDIIVISDEVYSNLTYGNTFHLTTFKTFFIYFF